MMFIAISLYLTKVSLLPLPIFIRPTHAIMLGAFDLKPSLLQEPLLLILLSVQLILTFYLINSNSL